MKAPAFSFYVRDWLCSTKVETMSGDGVKAYMYLLCKAWLETPRATLPMDDNALATMARVTPDKWRTISAEVMRCFTLGNNKETVGRYYSERLMEVSNLSTKRTLARKNKKRSKRITKQQQKGQAWLEDEDEEATTQKQTIHHDAGPMLSGEMKEEDLPF